jgi:hypothetical protein
MAFKGVVVEILGTVSEFHWQKFAAAKLPFSTIALALFEIPIASTLVLRRLAIHNA